MQPFISVFKNFKLLSELSATDLKSTTLSLGLSTVLDNEKSMKWTVGSGTTEMAAQCALISFISLLYHTQFEEEQQRWRRNARRKAQQVRV